MAAVVAGPGVARRNARTGEMTRTELVHRLWRVTYVDELAVLAVLVVLVDPGSLSGGGGATCCVALKWGLGRAKAIC